MYVYCLINWLLGPKNINVLQMIIFLKLKLLLLDSPY